jgi:hypothetical protein
VDLLDEDKMKTLKLTNLPIGILLIASFYVFGAFVLIINIFTNPVGVRETVARAHGFSSIIGVESALVVAVLALILAYGLIHLSRWGFILTFVYSLYLCAVSLVMGGLSFAWIGQPETQVYFGNLLWSALVIIYLLIVRRRFFEAKS